MANGHGGAREGAGRPAGAVSKAKRGLMAKAEKYAESALQTLVDVAGNVDESAAARVSAANSILDRAYGKPAQGVDLDAKISTGDPLTSLLEKVAAAGNKVTDAR